MEINFHKLPKRKLFVPWLVTTALTLLFIAALHLCIYYLFYSDSKTLTEHFANGLAIYIYALIWPFAIISSYRGSVLKVKHQGEVDPELVRDYFLNIGFLLIKTQDGQFRLEAQKWFNRLFAGSRFVTIEYTDNAISIEMPTHQLYNVHHGFKFANSFIRK